MGDLLYLRIASTSRFGVRRGTSATAWYERGCAQEGTDPASAMTAYARALAGRPDHADAHNNLGRLHHDRGELVVAESCYRLAICASSQIALYWFNLGVAVEDQGRLGEAITAYEHALALDPYLADAHFNLGRLLEVMGRSNADELVLRRAVRHLVRYRDLARVG
jgi:tetratricopeptide (TPR) repeat protein